MNLDICMRSVEFRAATPAEDGDGRTLEGYAAVFNAGTEINSWEGRFTETIAKGAFRKTLRERKNVLMQWNHGGDSRVGHTPIGHYTELREDDHGLLVKGRLFDNDLVEPIRQAIEAGAITGMSFKFRVVRDDWTDNAGKRIKPDELYELLYEPGERGPLVRNIKEVQLYEAGPVSTPAYEQTSVGVRSASEEDRQKLVAQYRASMAEQAKEDDAVERWLAAEQTWSRDFESWVVAEMRWKTELTDWLAAEQAHRTSVAEADAARSTSTSEQTSGNPQTTPPDQGTSDRDHKEKETEQRDSAVSRKAKKAMNIHELRALEKTLLTTITGLGDEFRDAEMPEDKVTEFDAAKADLAATRSKIKAIEDRAQEMKDFAAANPASTERGSDRGAPAFHRDRDIFDVDATRMDAKSPEDFVARIQDDAKKAIDGARFSRTVSKSAAQERAMELLESYDDENGTLAKRILITGSPVYERAFGKALKACSTAGLSQEEQRVMSLGGGSGAEGGFAVPFQLDPTVILTSPGVVGDIRSIARVETIVGKEWQGITSAGVTVSRDLEADEVSDDSFTLAQPKVKAERVQGFIPFSIEIDQDWGGLRSEITRMLADAKLREESASFAVGTGVAPNAEGFTLNAVAVSAGTGTATSTGFIGAVPASIYALEEAVDARWRANGKFVANKSVYNLIRQKDTAGGANLWERIGASTPNQLIGYDALENSAMSSVLTTGSKVLAFGDFQQFLIVDRVGMNVELVPHIFGANRRPTGQRGVYAIWRNNSKLLIPNAIKVLTTLT